jgi:UPF0755 protein
MSFRTVFVFLILVFLAGSFFFWQEFYLARDSDSENIVFQVLKGENIVSISQNLEQKGLIRHGLFFQTYAFLTGNYNKLKAGVYLLNPSMSIAEIIKIMVKGETAKIKVTIPEGLNLKQIEQTINEVSGGKVSLTDQRVNQYSQYSFFKNVPEDLSLEGFLFPDTYEFNLYPNQREVVSKMLNNFDRKLSPDLRSEIKNQGKTILEIITMASLLEKEVKNWEDKTIVSGILWKRLENRMPLQVDATISYITGKKSVKVTKKDTQIDSPYNTYKYLGLPPSPICNPGLESIKAALYPVKTSFWYYLSTPEGKTIFSQTLKQHNLAKQRYLR